MEPWQLGVKDIVDLVRRNELSPAELVDSLASRIEAVDGPLSAWVTVDADGAGQVAESLSKRLARGEEVGPLAGVPMAIKDVIDVAGLPTTASSRVLADAAPATEDAACVALLRQAGASFLGKAHTAEFACADPAPTRNPWNVEHTPGGSSSGSAVAVASGTVPAALGTQTGGSTLRPAAYNGIVGLKASYGLISNRGVIPVSWSFDHVGILARSVVDAAMILDAAAGYDPLDPSSAPEAGSFSRPAFDLDHPPVVGLIRTFFLEICEPEMAAHTKAVAARFEAAGAEVREIELAPSIERVVPTQHPIFRGEMYAYHREQYASSRSLYGPKNSSILEEGRRVLAADYVLAARERPAVVADLESALAGVDIALTPATPAPPPRNTTTTGDASFQTPWSYAGLPAIALPSGINAWGLPLGVQLVGHRWREAELLQAAYWCEAVLDFHPHPPVWETA